jgi:hypothetical protein
MFLENELSRSNQDNVFSVAQLPLIDKWYATHTYGLPTSFIKGTERMYNRSTLQVQTNIKESQYAENR